MQLKALDLLVCLELASTPGARRTYADLGAAVGLSASEADKAVMRASRAGLLQPSAELDGKPYPNVHALFEFLEHGVRYAFFAVPGRVTRGMATAHSAAPLNALLQSGADLPFVWPDPEGETRGQAIEPLYPSVPAAARRNASLYEMLALVDALRCGGARERKLALQELESRILRGAAA